MASQINTVVADLSRNLAPAQSQGPASGGQVVASSGNSLPLAAGGSSPSPEQIAKAVKDVSGFVQEVKRNIEFSVDQGTGRTVIRVIDAKTKEVIRQFPPEELIRMAEHLDEARGFLFRAKA